MLSLRTRWRPTAQRLLFQKFPHSSRKIPNRLTHKAAEEQSVLRTAQSQIRIALCKTRYAVQNIFDFWRLIRLIGVSNCRIVRFRRRLRRFHYPWLGYGVPAGVSLMAGDIVSQVFLDKRKKKRDMNWCRTIHYGLIGLFLLGPVTSRLFLISIRRVGRGVRLTRMTKALVYDVLFAAPIIVATIIAAYDYKFLHETLKTLKSDSLKPTRDKIVERYKNPFKEDMLFYLQTKPLIALATCFLLPTFFRAYVKSLYNIAFYSYVSNRDFKYKLGPEIQKYRAGKKQEGVGGPACMLRDTVVARLKDLTKKKSSDK